ncbi:MAG TPA: hypothetical protein VMW13_06230 [Dehalococcoidales bacterium]|nr:hypothetical protein [Dehalococcoidales bacterium]
MPRWLSSSRTCGGVTIENKTYRSAGTPGGMKPRDDNVYRDQKGRYLWWVRSVDRITTEVDESIMEKQGSTVTNRLIQQPFE